METARCAAAWLELTYQSWGPKCGRSRIMAAKTVAAHSKVTCSSLLSWLPPAGKLLLQLGPWLRICPYWWWRRRRVSVPAPPLGGPLAYHPPAHPGVPYGAGGHNHPPAGPLRPVATVAPRLLQLTNCRQREASPL